MNSDHAPSFRNCKRCLWGQAGYRTVCVPESQSYWAPHGGTMAGHLTHEQDALQVEEAADEHKRNEGVEGQ